MNEETIYKEIPLKDGYVLQISKDTMAESPREWSNLGTMTIFHKRYNFGDGAEKVPFTADDFPGFKEMEDHILNVLKAVHCLPIYMYDHGNITINTIGFSCPWDSGQVGFIYVTEETMQDAYGEHYTPEQKEEAKELLLGEVRNMDLYIQGEVYEFQILDNERKPYGDSCNGFYGDNICTNGMLDHIPSHLTEDLCKDQNLME